MAIAISELPRYLVLEPGGGIRLDMHLEATACEFDLALESPSPGRSFIVMIGHRSGTIVQRVRLAGKARILFDPEGPGDYTLVLTNPMAEPAVVRLRGSAVLAPAVPRVTRRTPGPATGSRRRKPSGTRSDRRSSRSK
jgi:hypothetical protein